MKDKFYAVKQGRKPGIYKTYNECKQQIVGFYRPIFRAFNTLEEAEAFLKEKKRFRIETETEEPEDETTFEIKKTKLSWSKTGSELAKDLVADAEIQEDDPKKVDTTSDIIPNSLPVTNRMHCWVVCDVDSFVPTMAVYFGENDSRNSVGICDWKSPKEKTRVGLACIVRAISRSIVYTMKNDIDTSKSSLIIHTENRYLCNAIIQFLKNWPNIPKDKNEDIYRHLRSQLVSTNLRIHCAKENSINRKELINAYKLLSEFEPTKIKT